MCRDARMRGPHWAQRPSPAVGIIAVAVAVWAVAVLGLTTR
ncbi:hypothetical protein [Streptomyces sp. MP131-18]|nr:hypothetical protein [Streptomyces sp. MP131-18]ONK14793.1 hypothetical protein STBA_55850 [Streptomyces sp. MP131-18]